MLRGFLASLLLGASLAACSGGVDEMPSSDTLIETTEEDPQNTTPPIESELKTADMSEAEKAAMDLFAYQEGVWTSKWVWYGPNGEVANSMEGTETFSYLTDAYSQMLTNVVPAMKQTSYAMLAFNPAEQQIIFMNIGPGGDYWIMRQNPVTGVMISDPHLNPDGSKTVLMFTTIRQTADTMVIHMQSSSDEGKSWVKEFTQTLTRKSLSE